MDKFVSREKRVWVDAHDDRPTVLELFAGAGGMAMGLEQAGFRHVALVEMEKHSVSSLRRNGFRHVLHQNAKDVDFTEYRGVDIVAGGPPCQPFSIAGLQAGSSDDRDGWPIAIRAVCEIQPRGFIFENVAGMAGLRFMPYVDCLKQQFCQLGYTVHIFKVDAANYNIPQHRRRVFFIGIHGESSFDVPAPSRQKVTVRSMMAALGPPNGRNGHSAVKGCIKEYGPHTASKLDEPSKTITAGSFGQAGGALLIKLDDGSIRRYTLREIARLQTFPDSYKLYPVWCHAAKQLGNACPPLLVIPFARELLLRINNTHHKRKRSAL